MKVLVGVSLLLKSCILFNFLFNKKLKKHNIIPFLAICFIESVVTKYYYYYLQQKILSCRRAGIGVYVFVTTLEITQFVLQCLVFTVSRKKHISSFFLQSPLPNNVILKFILSSKDVDVINPISYFDFCFEKSKLCSCVVSSVFHILKNIRITLYGKYVVILNSSNVVGLPLMKEFLRMGAIVSIVRNYDRIVNLLLENADVVVTALPVPNFLNLINFKENSIIIDVATIFKNGKVFGNLCVQENKKNSWFTPVPGGVGPTTVACVLLNTYILFSKILN